MDNSNDSLIPLPLVTRVEVIGEGGRLLTLHNVSEVQYSKQDRGKTIKIFLRGNT